jgi:hypothetical protein
LAIQRHTNRQKEKTTNRADGEADSVHIYLVSKWKQAPDERSQNTEATLQFMALFSKHSARLLEVGIDNRISIDGIRIPSFWGGSGKGKSRT